MYAYDIQAALDKWRKVTVMEGLFYKLSRITIAVLLYLVFRFDTTSQTFVPGNVESCKRFVF